MIQKFDSLKERLYALFLASRNTKTPVYIKFLLAGIVAYLVSPVDLIPDFIPIIGQLDELLLIPLGLWIAVCLIPNDVWEQSLAQATAVDANIPISRFCMFGVVLVWVFSIGFLSYCICLYLVDSLPY